ncbi:sigma-70 family RNA polymerase sigma factor [Azospirillum melinis]|uniref:Sigma-70 family RNA polymerase sigma factor n=1 Tax=Azospirillum melinis TaxID=328839 RepID=A0ABX2KD76_9PROT|nr:RNA polymerase factor sigma-32 [Azospirillum melinis]MBP2307247.1 RNA polymerase sigma-32 factor [Azospirillum melinis]NUB00643.1 sigma-70 family RNA polymerase sigma factor [Azospirillum melinis]
MPNKSQPLTHQPLAEIRSAEPLTLFLKDMRRYDLLTPEEERELARRWRDHDDAEALDRLIGGHLRLVVGVAKRFQRYGLPLADLVAEGNIGLMRAARKFDPEKGFRFSTYAHWWIRAAIQDHVLQNWSLVKIGSTTAHRTLFFGLRHLKAKLKELDSGDLSPEAAAAIATELDLPERDVVEMNRRLAADHSLNATVGEESEMEWQDLLADDRADQETALAETEERIQQKRLIALGLEKLTERDRQILIARRLLDEPVPADELSRRFNLSRQRIGQIEVAALQTIRKAVLAGRAAQTTRKPVKAQPAGSQPARPVRERA